ncbi:hypothetical protein AB0A73_22115 [Glycomyces sp. NPDC047369]
MTAPQEQHRQIPSAVQVLGLGVLRQPEAEGRTGWEGMVALHHPATEQRLALHRVPLGGTGTLVAVLHKDTWPGLTRWTGLHTQGPATVSLALARGHVCLEISGAVGGEEADLAGCSPRGDGWCWLNADAVGFAADRSVRLEIHRACTCQAPPAAPTPVQAAA